MSIKEAIRYGAFELKRNYSRHLVLAVIVSISIHLMLIGLYTVAVDNGTAAEDITPRDPVVLIDIKSPDIEKPKPEAPSNAAAKSKTPSVPNDVSVPDVKPDVLSGKHVATPDDLIDTTLPDVASLDQLNNSGPDAVRDGILNDPNAQGFNRGGRLDGNGGGDSGSQGGAPKVSEVEKPVDIWEIPEQNRPRWDEGALKKRTVYPRLAESNNIEGRVVLRVLISRYGEVDKIEVLQSDNALFTESARTALENTTFTPAIVGTTPVPVWITIPFNFTLEK